MTNKRKNPYFSRENQKGGGLAKNNIKSTYKEFVETCIYTHLYNPYYGKFGVERIGLTREEILAVVYRAEEVAEKAYDESKHISFDRYVRNMVSCSLEKYIEGCRNTDPAA